MKKIMILGLAVIFAVAWLASAPVQAADKGAALIVSVSGDVAVQRGGKQKAVTGKFPLQWGDKVMVKKGSATVLYATGKKVVVKDTHEISQANAKVEGKAGSSAASAVVASASSDLKAKSGVGGVTRAAGGEPDITILAYVNTTTTETRPVFAWQPSEEVKKVTFTLLDENGEEVWSTVTDQSVLAWPEDKDPLSQDMEYTFMITPDLGGAPVTEDYSSTFYILDEEAAAEVKDTVAALKAEYSADDDMVIQHLLLGQYYKQNELYMDAIDELKKLVALDEKDVYSWAELAGIYGSIGMNIKAKEAQQKVEALEKEFGATGDEF